MTEVFKSITRDELEALLEEERPDNHSRSSGVALVNVLDRDSFEQEHIPGSINIPQADLAEFERRFDRSKRVVVYCASSQCEASKQVASELAERGFQEISHYEGGMEEWGQYGNPVEGEVQPLLGA